MKARKLIALLLCLTMVLSMGVTAAFAAGGTGVGGGDNIEVDFPEIYPESALSVDTTKRQVSMKVEALLKTMTEEEIYSMLGGHGSANSSYGYGTGWMPGVPRLGVPASRSWDGPKGVIADRQTLETTSPASQLALGQSWDRDLAYEYGVAVGKDNKASAGNMQLGTQVDLTRSMIAGRERDTISEDPYLVAQITDPYAEGIEEQNVIAVLKHYACYVAEFTHGKDNVVIDEQSLHETYLYPFEYVIRNGNANGVMSAYNLINGVQAASHDYLQNTVLRDMWGFEGLVVTDWGGNNEICIKQGTDLEMGSIKYHEKEGIEAAIAAGEMSWDDVLNAVRHTLTAMGNVGYLGLVTVNQSGYAVADENPPECIELTELASGSAERFALLDENDAVAYESSVGSAVLLKNEGGALPVSADDSIAVIGLPGARTVTGHYSESAFGYLGGMSGTYEELVNELGTDADVTFAIGNENIFGNEIPSEWLYQDQEATKNGVVVEITEGEATRTEILDNLKMTTNSKTYVNGADGNAVEYGQKATVSTWIKVPETGTYGIKVMNAGFNEKNASLYNPETDDMTTLLEKGMSCGPAAGAFGTSSSVCSETGMDIPSSFKSVELEAGKVYQITMTVEPKNEYIDGQFQIVYETEATRAADEQAMIDAASAADKIIFIGHDKETTFEGLAGRPTQLDMLRKCIAAAKDGAQIIVVLETAMPGVMREWIDDVDAVLYMSLPGQAGARAEAALLTGKVNPSGKLSDTVVKSVDYTKFGEGYQGHSNADEAIGNTVALGLLNNGEEGDPLTSGEGIYNGYKWYDHFGKQEWVEFDFGFGLSYTTFAYSDMSVEKVPGETAYNVTFTLTNTGSVAGKEVAQVYLGKAQVPDGIQMAEIALAGFDKVELQPGESKEVTIKVEERQLSYWDPNMEVESESDEKWTVAEGERTFYVGASSDNLLLEQVVDVTADSTGAAADLVIGNAATQPGETVDIDVRLENSKGIAGYLVNLRCDTDVITIEKISDGGATFGGHFEVYKNDSGYNVLWSNNSNVTKSGVMFTIKAKVAEDAEDGVYPITAVVSDINTADENGDLVTLNVVDGSITVKAVVAGDLNGDGVITNVDIIMLARYLVHLVEFDEEQLKAGDYDKNGEINNSDLVAMARYVVEKY